MVFDVPDYQCITSEFGLGRLLKVELLAGDSGSVKLTATGGEFVVKAADGEWQTRLYERVSQALNRLGLRQARLLRTTTGALISQSGRTVQEFLPGRVCPQPTRVQTGAVMRYIGAYHLALGRIPAPADLRADANSWVRVTSPDYLIGTLPGLLHRSGLPAESQRLVTRALGRLETRLPQLHALAPQLVHGDIGPDNVLMDGDQVLALIDFTPHYQPVLFAVATAVYWYHVHAQPTLDPLAIRASLTAAGEHRPWTNDERVAWPAMLLRESLRRLASPLAVAAEHGTPTPARTGVRYQAVSSIMRSWDALAQDHGLAAPRPRGPRFVCLYPPHCGG
jgi:Ser/Thr protein kinase RdoA (MazF antagonist)